MHELYREAELELELEQVTGALSRSVIITPEALEGRFGMLIFKEKVAMMREIFKEALGKLGEVREYHKGESCSYSIDLITTAFF